MKELIHIHNQGSDLRADSRDVAKLFGIQRESIHKLIENHTAQLEQLGHVRFEIGGGKIRPQGGGTPEKFAYLNFDQIAFLLTISSPTEATKDFRLRLIMAFRDARQKLRPIDRALLTMPDEWKHTFPASLYEALLKLYGAKFETMGDTPSWVGKWTNKFIYETLYAGLPDELKKRRALHAESADLAEWKKMHQFIEKHAKANLEKHITKITVLLEASTSPSHFLELFATVFYGRQQLLLITPDIRDEFS
jgi:hypothetical protein